MKLLLGGRSTGGSLKRSTRTPHSEARCEGCVNGKIVCPPFPPSDSRAKSVLDLIHTDLCGPMGIDGQKKYMMVIVDNRTRYTWVYFLERKSDALECFKHWLVRVERLTEKKLKTVRSDNGGEYTSKGFEGYLRDKGIEHQTTIPYSSQQNGIAERANRTIVERTIALLHSESLPISVWDHIAESVVYLKNRSPTRSLHHSITPFEAMFGERPNLSNLRVIGCVAYNMILKHRREGKLSDRATLCYLLGYSPTQKGWKLWDPTTRKIVLSRDVVFDETKDASVLGRTARSIVDISTLLGHSPAPPPQDVASNPLDVVEAVGDDLETVGDEVEETEDGLDTDEQVGAEDREDVGGQLPRHPGWEYEVDPRYARSRGPSPELDDPIHNPPAAVCRSTRDKRPVNYNLLCKEAGYERELDDFLGHPSNPELSPSSALLQTWPSTMTSSALASLACQQDPRSWKEAMAANECSDWRQAADEEMDSLKEAGVFKVVPRSEARG